MRFVRRQALKHDDALVRVADLLSYRCASAMINRKLAKTISGFRSHITLHYAAFISLENSNTSKGFFFHLCVVCKQ